MFIININSFFFQEPTKIGYQLCFFPVSVFTLVFVVVQMVVSASGRLAGGSGEDQLPTILVVAHYDAGGGAPGLAAGADSNGSGVAMLLELARLFAPLYSSSRNAIFMELKGSLSCSFPYP
jgi:Zn-dependent M28 family amino/carboxypeptidase